MADYDEAIFPKVSILILAKNNEMALKRTLLSALEQSYHDYELFIAFSEYEPGTREWVVPERPGVDIRSFSFGRMSDSALLSTALTHLRGVYVQILFPGFTYFSCCTLHDVMQSALEQQFPSLLYTATMRQDKDKAFPTLLYHPLSVETLRIGQTPTELGCCWIRRDLFEHLGEWVPEAQEEYAWRFFCQLRKLEGLHTYGIKKIFMENQIPNDVSSKTSYWHACKRILKTFGPLQMLRYLWNTKW